MFLQNLSVVLWNRPTFDGRHLETLVSTETFR